MKKTIIALLALSGVVMADYSLTLDKAGYDITETTYQLDGLTLTVHSSTPFAPGATGTVTSTDYTNSLWTVNSNIGDGGVYFYSLNFSISDVAEDKSLDSISLDFFTHSGGGSAQNDERNFTANITLTPEGQNSIDLFNGTIIVPVSTDHNYTGSAYVDGTAKGSYYTWNTDGLALGEGTYILTVSVSQASENNKGGTYVGLGQMELATTAPIPEPTTATLSLLALAGLAARRRRR